MGDDAWARVMGSEDLYLYIVHICVLVHMYVVLRTTHEFDIRTDFK